MSGARGRRVWVAIAPASNGDIGDCGCPMCAAVASLGRMERRGPMRVVATDEATAAAVLGALLRGPGGSTGAAHG